MNKNPRIILIGGPPVVGKSSLAHELSKKIGIKRIVDLDILRDTLRKEKPKKSDPYLHYYSTTAWKIKGDYTKNKLINSYRNYCKSLKKAIKTVIGSAYKFKIDTIIEGVHLLPEFFKEYSKKKNFEFFILKLNKRDYIKNIHKRKKENNGVTVQYLLERVDKSTILGEYLVEQSNKLRIPVIDNSSLKESCDIIIKSIGQKK